MAETIFTRKQIKELPFEYRFTDFRLLSAIIPWLAENFFMRYSPGNTRDWNCQNEQVEYLLRQIHLFFDLLFLLNPASLNAIATAC